MVEDTGEICCPGPFPSFTMILVIPTTLSQDRKLTHDKTLPMGFTKRMEQLSIAFKIWCPVDIFTTVNTVDMVYTADMIYTEGAEGG